LKHLPSQLSNLKKLKDLNISDNNITRIENIPDNVRQLSIYANPVDYIDPSIPDRFTESSRESHFDYLFVDREQANALKLEIDKFGYQLKITDLSARTIHRGDYKYMPPELIKKWELREIADAL
jgi:Leucine-rich repeat (LRR) protein